MDQHKTTLLTRKVEITLANLAKNNMQGIFVPRKEAVIDRVKELILEGATVACGGSMTLEETGVFEHLRSGRYRFLDRTVPGLTPEQIREVYIGSFAADVYLCSSNAVTETGELYNVDGNSNRVAAMLYGPKSVIVIAGWNKLVRDREEAIRRVENLAAPANCLRLQKQTPCIKTGHCTHCGSPDRICCNFVVMAQQRHANRIKIILVGEDLGY